MAEKEEIEFVEPTRKQLLALMQMRFAPENRMAHERWLACIAGVCGGNIDRDGLQRILEGDHPRIIMEMETVGLVPDMRIYQFMWPPEVTVEAVGCYADEEVESSVGYPSGWQLKSAAIQAATLLEFFPFLNVSYVERLADGMKVPEGFDGIGVVPKISAMPVPSDRYMWPQFNRALIAAQQALAQRDDKSFDRGSEFGPHYVSLRKDTQDALQRLEEVTPGDCLALPVQLGRVHAGKSPRRARECLVEREFGLDAFSLTCLLLTHADRTGSNILNVDALGSCFSELGDLDPDGDEVQSVPGMYLRGSPFFRFQQRCVSAAPEYGSATGFFQESRGRSGRSKEGAALLEW